MQAEDCLFTSICILEFQDRVGGHFVVIFVCNLALQFTKEINHLTPRRKVGNHLGVQSYSSLSDIPAIHFNHLTRTLNPICTETLTSLNFW